jgi:hypothetical protein
MNSVLDSDVAGGSKGLRTRICTPPLFFAVLSCVLFSSHFGTDYEEIPTISYSVGSPASRLIPPLDTDAGLYRLMGSPLYDFRQGLGTRLPTQGNWALSPSVYLGGFLNIKQFTLFHIFLSTFCMAIAGSLCLWTYQVRQQMLRQIVFFVVGLGFVSIFARSTDWSTVIRVNASIVTVVCLLLIKLRSNQWREFSTGYPLQPLPSVVTRLLAVYGIGDLILQHPGALPMASVIIGSCFLAMCWESNLKLSVSRFKISYKLYVCVTVVLLNIVIIYIDFNNGLGGDFQSRVTDGLAIPNFLDGFLGNILPAKIELGASVLVANAVLPLLLVPGLYLFPDSARLQAAVGNFDRSSFALFGALIVIAVLLRRRTYLSLNSLQRTILFTFTSTFLYIAVQDYRILPSELSTTSPWVQIHSLRLILCLALLIITGSAPSQKSRVLTMSMNLNLALAVLYALVVMGLVGPKSWILSPQKSDSAAYNSIFVESNLNSVSRLFREDGNFRFAVIQGGTNDALNFDSVRFLDIASTGTPLVFPVWTKARSTEPLFKNDVGIGRQEVTRERLDSQLLVDHERFWDFLNIRTLIVPSTSISRPDSLEILTPKYIQVSQPPEALGDLKILRRQGFSTFFRRKESLGHQHACILIGGDCEALSNSAQGPIRGEPRLRICSGGCLATFDFDISAGVTQAWILLPIRYDPVIQALDSKSFAYLETRDAGGLLEVKLPEGISSGSFKIQIQPDLLMILRSIAPIVNLVAAVLIIVPFSKNQNRRSRA